MEGFRDELTEAEADLNAVYDADQGRRPPPAGPAVQPGRLPAGGARPVRRGVGLPVSVEPPSYLMRIAPEVYEQEQAAGGRPLRGGGAPGRAGVRRRVRPAAVPPDRAAGRRRGRRAAGLPRLGGRPTWRSSSSASSDLNVRSNPELDALVEQAQQLVRGRRRRRTCATTTRLRQHVAAEMAQVQAQLEGLIVDAPRRRIVRAQPSAQRRQPCSC